MNRAAEQAQPPSELFARPLTEISDIDAGRGPASTPHISVLRRTSTRSLRRQATFNSIHGAAAADSFKAQVQSFRTQIRRHERWSRFVLHPARRNFLHRWDMVTAGALLYTLSLTPFEAAFLPPTLGAAAWGDPWFLVNR